jgi:A/G-specific adenine glycosylase
VDAAAASTADRRRLLDWYEPRRSAYPWRADPPDPYRVLVSEVMLQQTQAPRVAPIFEAFVRRFPDVRALARASRADVIKAWAGLGYHRRAVALHEAAGAIVARHGGCVPDGVEALLSRPGVGPYTASAVASIAFGERRAAVDTNVRRIAARYLFGAEPDEVARSALAAGADDWVDPGRPADWNQALMDLGRDVCRPRPRCDGCPLRRCRFRAAGRVGRPTSRPQAAFDGSVRQLRGRILAALRARPTVDVRSIGHELGEPAERIAVAVDGLVRDGLAARTGSALTLAR